MKLTKAQDEVLLVLYDERVINNDPKIKKPQITTTFKKLKCLLLLLLINILITDQFI